MNQTYTPSASAKLGDEGTVGQTAVQLPICGRTVITELSGDFSLPDYQPEIKRLLRIGVSILPPERYASGDTLDLEGNLDYFALYMGNDNRLYCAPLSTDYRMSLSLSEERERSRGAGGPSPLDGNLTCTCSIVADPVTGRVTAPRRLSIKSRLKAAVQVYGTCPLSIDGTDTAPTEGVEQLFGVADTLSLSRGQGEMLALQDDMILASGDKDMRVVCAEGQVMVHETAAGQNNITCRGDVLLKVILCPADEEENSITPPTVSTRKIPFSQVVEVDGVTPDCLCCGFGACSEMSVEIEDGHLHTDLGIVLEVLAQKNISVPFTKDLYATHKHTDCHYASRTTHEALGCFNANFTLSNSLPLSDTGIHSAAKIIDISAAAYPEAMLADAEKKRCILTGRCKVQMILFRDGEYTAQELELPFRYERDHISVENQKALIYDGAVKVTSCRARMDGERIGIDAEISVAIRMATANDLTTLASVTYGDDVVRRRGEYIICFPAPKDTLWTVAKRYHAPLAALSAANNLPSPTTPDSADSLDGVGYLIV